MGHRSEETKLSKSPPSIAPVSRAFARIDQDAPAAWQQAATSAGEQQRNSSAVAPPAAAPPAAAPPPAAVALPLLSIHSVFRDRFVRVNARGGLRADAEFPWSDESWFRALPQLCAQERVPALSGQAKENEVGAAPGGDDDPAAELERRLSRTWFALQSERVGKLLSLHDGREKPGRGGGASGAPSRAFVPLAELSPPSRRRRAPHAAHRPEEPRAPPSACWRLEEGGLRNRGSRGWLNVRPSGATTCIEAWACACACGHGQAHARGHEHGHGRVHVPCASRPHSLPPTPRPPHAAGDLRGHGNQGPPWRTADIAVPSTELLLLTLTLT